MYVMHTSGQLFWEFYNVNTLLLHVHVQLQLSFFLCTSTLYSIYMIHHTQ